MVLTFSNFCNNVNVVYVESSAERAYILTHVRFNFSKTFRLTNMKFRTFDHIHCVSAIRWLVMS